MVVERWGGGGGVDVFKCLDCISYDLQGQGRNIVTVTIKNLLPSQK